MSEDRSWNWEIGMRKLESFHKNSFCKLPSSTRDLNSAIPYPPLPHSPSTVDPGLHSEIQNPGNLPTSHRPNLSPSFSHLLPTALYPFPMLSAHPIRNRESALRPIPYALCSMLYALCALPFKSAIQNPKSAIENQSRLNLL